MSATDKYPNNLIRERSPYLLQHAYNPVQWYAWGEEPFAKAKMEKKLVLVSIGYSACHWCHVMENQCFEDQEVAALMNSLFINIKVDREERPDVDHVYMSSVQLMTQHGGWPLNCFVLPDGRPVYGGTYFPKTQWMQVLKNLAGMYQSDPHKFTEYASRLVDGVKQMDLVIDSTGAKSALSFPELLEKANRTFQLHFDTRYGGSLGTPKFMMPANLLFLLRYGHLTNDENNVNQVHLTLEKMAFGGIYDQLGGGFSRYSTDERWKVPHFEKMLYDNAQLISVYSEAFLQNGNPLYKQVVYETIAFVERDLTSPLFGFYSALDADSEGKEGWYYTWTEEELNRIVKKDAAVFKDYYAVNEWGYWEDEQYILCRNSKDQEVASRHEMNIEDLQQLLLRAKDQLLKARQQRVAPGLDDKILCSWNGLMCAALCDAYRVFGEPSFLSLAEKNAWFIKNKLMQPSGELNHCFKEVAYIEGFLEDYAFVTDAFLKLFALTGKQNWLTEAELLIQYSLNRFFDEKKSVFYFAEVQNNGLFSVKIELQDNVIPASNSQMAKNLFILSKITGNDRYDKIASLMIRQVEESMPVYPAAYANWLGLVLQKAFPFFEVCIVGNAVDVVRSEWLQAYIPNAIFLYCDAPSDLSIFKNRYEEGKTKIYVCQEQSCKQPVSTIQEALKLMR